jgi:hypothetical protein
LLCLCLVCLIACFSPSVWFSRLMNPEFSSA